MSIDGLLPDDDAFRHFHVAIACEPARVSELCAEIDRARDAHRARLAARHAREAPEGWALAPGGTGELVEIDTLHEHRSPSYWARDAAVAFLARCGETTPDDERAAITLLRAVEACARRGATPFGIGAVPLAIASALGGGVLGDAHALGVEIAFWLDEGWQDLPALVAQLRAELEESRAELDDASESRVAADAMAARLRERIAGYEQELRAIALRGDAVAEVLYRAP